MSKDVAYPIMSACGQYNGDSNKLQNSILEICVFAPF